MVHDSPRRAYYFLEDHAKTGDPFTSSEMTSATRWTESTFITYKSKYLRGLVVQRNKTFFVKPEFLKLSVGRFRALSTQVKNIFATFDRTRYGEVITYEFLLPLTRENLLRSSLDELFYSDTLAHRLREIGLADVASWPGAQRVPRESDADYVARVCLLIAEKFSGYSISHLSGRFRFGQLASREEAAQLLVENQRYLIDETTASVRFVIPVSASKTRHPDGFGDTERRSVAPNLEIAPERSFIRRTFFEIFVESIVRSVIDEDEIWLIEESTLGRQLYVWRRPSDDVLAFGEP